MARPALQRVPDRATQQNFDEIFLNWPEGVIERTPFTYSNGWRNFGGAADLATGFGGYAGFYKDSSGFVHLEGLLDKNGGNWGAETVVTLPVGYRPLAPRLFFAAAANLMDVVRVDVNPNGTVATNGLSSRIANPVGYLSLDGIIFKAYQ